jgi:hypothetical protein
VIQITHNGIEFSDNPSILLATGELPGDLQPAPTANKCGGQIKVVTYRIVWGLAMNAVSVLRTRTVNSRACDQESQKQDEAGCEGRPISLLSVLEAENIRLRQAVVELLIDTVALREALRGREVSAPWRGVQAKRSASGVQLRQHSLRAETRRF